MKCFRNILILIFVCAASCFSYGQKMASDTGKVEFAVEDNVQELLLKHVVINTNAPIKGYRVKIHFGTDKNKAREIRGNFNAKFPYVPAYEKYDQPNFNIRVGDFRTKLEASKFLKEVQVEFPSAFLVQDEIEFPALEKVK